MTPTADLMKLVEKWRVDAAEYGKIGCVGLESIKLDCADQLAAALSAMGEARVGGEVVVQNSVWNLMWRMFDYGKDNNTVSAQCLTQIIPSALAGEYVGRVPTTPAQPKASEHPMDEVGRMMFGDHPKASEGEAGREVRVTEAMVEDATHAFMSSLGVPGLWPESVWKPYEAATRAALSAALTKKGAG